MNIDLFDSIQESIILCDHNGCIGAWNAASERLYGWERTEALGRSVHELLQTQCETVPLIEAGLRSAAGWEGDVLRRTANGTLITMHLKYLVYGTGQIMETGIDVTVQRRVALEASEERYRHLFHFLPVAMFQLDRRELAGVFTALVADGLRDLKAYFEALPIFTTMP